MTESSAAFVKELTAIKSFLDAAQAELKAGSMPDITSLEKRVADVCLNIQNADEAVQKQCLPALGTILQGLDDCEKGMREWHAATMKVGDAP